MELRSSPVSSITMLRFALPAAAAVVVLVAAGCGHSGGHSAAIVSTSAPKSSPSPCKLDRAQRRAVALALADIRRLRRIETRMQTFSQRGAPHQNELTGKFMLDLGSAHLPLNTFSRLLHLAKGAVRLCGDCSLGLEADEPVLGNRPGTVHAKKGRCG